MSQNRNNWLGDRSSTRVHAPPGGRSNWSFGGSVNEAPPTQPPKAQVTNPPQKQYTQPSRAIGESIPKSNAQKVLEFTTQTGTPCPNVPHMMDKKETNFITKMILDEVLELLATQYSPEEAKGLMIEMIQRAKNVPQIRSNNTTELIAEQADAFVDIWYYSLNAAAKKGVNLSKIFDRVHDANMAKRDPATGQFLRREDGKIIKPQGWKPPNVTAEILQQANQ